MYVGASARFRPCGTRSTAYPVWLRPYLVHTCSTRSQNICLCSLSSLRDTLYVGPCRF